MGISNAFVGTGNLLGPIISGMLIDNFNDYNLIIYLTIGGYILALLAMVVANYFAIRESNASLAKQASVLTIVYHV
ncbi:hypothetical protein DSO57_1024878 [Entomophthora muscae]|uniref:Uncharacterized protein n=1 Tax=Entomophthora muscae TaxID=34485 RepID=A0ACC2RTD5_9FUNG|nr:hypothetical protein DSO57_1024878 [Entomophthora muscae]